MGAELILLAGYSGAGKTTLEKAALAHIPTLRYLRNTTTRPRGARDKHEHDYDFVDDEEYERRKRDSPNWSHMEYAGHSYGIDVDATNYLLEQGHSVLGSAVPDTALIERLRGMFAAHSCLIWLDTPLAVANENISRSDQVRRSRINNPLQTVESGEAVKRLADYVFKPTGVVQVDQLAFVALMQNIMNSSLPTC
jgi:guanylate kinase